MKTTTGILSLALALALPASALADNYNQGSGTSTNSSVRGTTSSDRMNRSDLGRGRADEQGADDSSLRRGREFDESTTGAARGGGPQRGATTTAPSSADRGAMLHAASPHIIAVQTELDAARVMADGLARMAALEPGAISAPYREDTRALHDSIRSHLQAAETHLLDLRSSIQQLNLQDRLGNDLAQVDQLVQRARTDLGQLESGQPAQQSTGGGPVATAVRDTSRTVSRELQQARSAMDRIERNMR